MWRALRETYRDAWRFAFAVPVVAAAVITLEAAQHAAEWMTGMYVSLESAKAAENSPARMILGAAKVGLLMILGYWVPRFIFGAGSRQLTLAADPVAIRKFLLVLAYGLVLGVLTHAMPKLLAAMGVTGGAAGAAFGGYVLATILVGVALNPWTVGAAVADPQTSPLNALRMSRGSLLWGLLFTLLLIIPPMAVHYALGLGAIGKPPAIAAAMLSLDALFVGFLGILLACGHVTIAKRIAAKKNHVFPVPRTGEERRAEAVASA